MIAIAAAAALVRGGFRAVALMMTSQVYGVPATNGGPSFAPNKQSEHMQSGMAGEIGETHYRTRPQPEIRGPPVYVAASSI